MYLMFYIVPVFLVQTNCKLVALPDELSSRISLSKCVNNAADYFSKQGQIISLSLAMSKPLSNIPGAVPFDNILLSTLFLKNKWSLMIRKAVLKVPVDKCLRKISNYIIQIRELEEISYTLKILKDDILWNPQANFFIISTTVFDNVTSVLKNTVENLWKYNIVNVVMLFPTQNNNIVYQVYTWFPFSEGRCGDYFEVRLIDSCEYGIFEYNGWFKDKIPKNLSKCVVKIRTSLIPPFVMQSKSHPQLDGFEIKLLNTVADVTNLSLSYSLSEETNPYGEILANGTVTGSYFDLMNESVGIIMGYVVPRIDTQFNFDILPSYFQDSLVICVPHSKLKNDWTQLTGVANTSVVLLCIFLIVIITAIIFGYAKLEFGETNIYKSLTGISFNLLGLLIGTPVLTLAKSRKIRMFLIIWIIFSLHFRTAYVSNLMTTLTNIAYEEEMNRIEDIFEHKLNLLLYPLCERYLNMMKLKYLTTVLQCNNITACLQRTAYAGDSATCTSKLNVNYLMHGFVDRNGKPKIHCFKDNLVTFPIQMLMWKGFPFKKRIATLVEKLNAAGFIFKWQRDIFSDFCNSQLSTRADGNVNTVLNITHLSAVFLLFAIGIIVSTVSFLLEILVFRKVELHYTG